LGFGAIEVDTWLQPTLLTPANPTPYENLTLYTGHKEEDLRGKTLKEEYLDPIIARLDANNAQPANGTGRKVGLYIEEPDFEVQLLIDMVSSSTPFRLT